MRILLYNWRDLAHPRAGGAEVYTDRVSRSWAAAGHEVTIFASTVASRPSQETVDGVTIIRRGNRRSVYREARNYYLKEGRGRFDLVIDEINTRPFMTPTFVKDTPLGAIVHQVANEVWFHEMTWPAAAFGCYVLEPRWLKAYKSVPITTLSASSQRSLEAHGLHRVTTVPVGLDSPSMAPVADKAKRPTALFVGRLASNKRPDHAIRAVMQAASRLDDIELWVVGTGPMEAKLRKDSGPNVRFFGRVSEEEKVCLMQQAHVLIATSVREGWGLVVSEAAAVGTVTVGYDVDGLRDSIAASKGFLVHPSPAALAERLVDVLGRAAAGECFAAIPGGVAPWDEVARRVLVALLGEAQQEKTKLQGHH